MRLLIDIAIGILVAVVVGFTTALLAVERGPWFGAMVAGPWVAWPQVGGSDTDPYSLAILARTGEVPLGDGEGLAFTADTDDDGQSLRGDCAYEVTGQTPTARLWTLTAYDDAGHLMANPARRSGFHSREIVRAADGAFAIVVSSEVRPGNWLPIANVEHFRLVFRLYDTPLTTGARTVDLTMPHVVRTACP